MKLRLTLATLAVLVIAGGLVVLHTFEPGRYHDFYPQCLFHALTGFHCPGCGATRCLYRLLHGDLPGALHMNALLFVLLPLIAYGAAYIGWELLHHRPAPSIIVKPFWSWLLVIAVIGFCVVRNLPWWPCTLLAPY